MNFLELTGFAIEETAQKIGGEDEQAAEKDSLRQVENCNIFGDPANYSKAVNEYEEREERQRPQQDCQKHIGEIFVGLRFHVTFSVSV